MMVLVFTLVIIAVFMIASVIVTMTIAMISIVPTFVVAILAVFAVFPVFMAVIMVTFFDKLNQPTVVNICAAHCGGVSNCCADE